MKTAYFDCFCGAGGDMIIAAMLDAGIDGEVLISKIKSLGLGAEIKISRVKRCGIEATHFEVIEAGHHHHEHQKHANHETAAGHHDNDQVEHHHHHHRTLPDIKGIIRQSEFSQNVKENAIRIFERLGQAEAKMHGKHIDEVHFHEVGAVDSIIDVVTACAGLEMLGCDNIMASALAVGWGTVKTAHGILPVPCPATAELVKGVPITPGPVEMELLTPTAAAILTTFVKSYGPMPAMAVEQIGYGAGSKDSLKAPNVLRLCVGQTQDSQTDADTIVLLETNCDDITGETAGEILNMAMEAGALDAFITPIYMKHNRPAMILSVICPVDRAGDFEKLLFTQGVTLGIRKQVLPRAKLNRDVKQIVTEVGAINIKIGFYNGEIVFAKPEIADCIRIAKEKNLPLKQVVEIAMAQWRSFKH